MEEDSLFEYDELRMYFGEPYFATDKIKILQPTIGQILEFGEKEFYGIVSIMCANTTMYRLPLWDIGIDWNKISDFELFISLVSSLKQEQTRLLFGDLDFTKFKIFDGEKLSMIYIPDTDIEIDEFVYKKISDYMRHMFDIHPKVEYAKNMATKEGIIEEDRINIRIQEKKNKGKNKNKSILFPLVSSMLNHPGFKYKKSELKEIGIVEFMDSVKRLQTYESVKSLMSGMYSGMLDTSKLDLSKELNWTRDIYDV